jgi:uncharacterized protein YndB with AHSA1/START domain
LVNEILEARAALQIQKPVHEVFEAIVDPAKMSRYFISKSSGRMEEGKRLTWKYPEYDTEFIIQVGKIKRDKYVSWSHWDADGREFLNEINLSPGYGDSTIVKINAKGWENSEAGIKWLIGNTEGWAYFLACLKAYLEYGINLRKGAFDYRKH